MDSVNRMEKQFNLLKKLVILHPDAGELMHQAHEIEKIIKNDLPKALENEAPPELPALCFDMQEVYEQFEDFLVFQDLIGKSIVALGGGFSTGKSFFLNTLLSENSDKRVRLLPTDTDASTAVPTYLLHSPVEEKINAINMFDSKVADLTVEDVRVIAHDFEEDNPGVSLGQLIQRMFIATPLQKYDNIAFLDTPGYSKPDSDTYSARTDEQIAREQLNHSHYILWFVASSTLPKSDVRFLQALDPHIPKTVILNKVDKILPDENSTFEDEYKKVIQGIKETLAKNGIDVEGVWGYSRNSRWREKIPEDVKAIHDLLDRLNQRKETSRFGHDFMKLFVECNKYYRKELTEEEARLKRVNQAITLSDQDAVSENLEDSRVALTSRISRLRKAQENLNEQRTKFFDLIRKVAAEVNIDIPTPTELELAEENAADPAAILEQLMEKSGRTADPILIEKMESKFKKLVEKDSALPGGVGYEKRLFNLLKEKLNTAE